MVGGRALPGSPHASELQYLFRRSVPYQPSRLSPAQEVHMYKMVRAFFDVRPGHVRPTQKRHYR